MEGLKPATWGEVAREVSRAQRLQEAGADFFLGDLAGRIIIVTSYDPDTGKVDALLPDEDNRHVVILAQGSVARRKLRQAQEWIRENARPVAVRVVRRRSKRTGNIYIDLVDPSKKLDDVVEL